jgi:2-hydroxychromene-2-carboxylate isomerase
VHAGLKAAWADEPDIADAETLVRLADQSGLDGWRLLFDANDPAVQERETSLTRDAVDRKLFGAPFYFYRDEPFSGRIVSTISNRRSHRKDRRSRCRISEQQVDPA